MDVVLLNVYLTLLAICAVGLGATGCVLWARSRRQSLTRGRIRIEVHAAHVVDDLVIEWVWRTRISITNRSRRPRRLPVLASRAIVTAGRKAYLAEVFLERSVEELSPEEVAIADLDFTLPAGLVPRIIKLDDLATGSVIRLSIPSSPQSAATHQFVIPV